MSEENRVTLLLFCITLTAAALAVVAYLATV